MLVFVAIALPLLIICLDPNKKKATIDKLNAAKARIAQIRCPRPKLPQCRRPPCPKLPRRQPRSRSVAASTTQPPIAQQQPHPEPSNSGLPTEVHIAAPGPAVPQTVPEASVPPLPTKSNEMSQDSSHLSKRDEPPPYPGTAYPQPLPGYYPPPTWSDPAYPPAAEPPGIGFIDNTSPPADS